MTHKRQQYVHSTHSFSVYANKYIKIDIEKLYVFIKRCGENNHFINLNVNRNDVKKILCQFLMLKPSKISNKHRYSNNTDEIFASAHILYEQSVCFHFLRRVL